MKTKLCSNIYIHIIHMVCSMTNWPKILNSPYIKNVECEGTCWIIIYLVYYVDYTNIENNSFEENSVLFILNVIILEIFFFYFQIFSRYCLFYAQVYLFSINCAISTFCCMIFRTFKYIQILGKPYHVTFSKHILLLTNSWWISLIIM